MENLLHIHVSTVQYFLNLTLHIENNFQQKSSESKGRFHPRLAPDGLHARTPTNKYSGYGCSYSP